MNVHVHEWTFSFIFRIPNLLHGIALLLWLWAFPENLVQFEPKTSELWHIQQVKSKHAKDKLTLTDRAHSYTEIVCTSDNYSSECPEGSLTVQLNITIQGVLVAITALFSVCCLLAFTWIVGDVITPRFWVQIELNFQGVVIIITLFCVVSLEY